MIFRMYVVSLRYTWVEHNISVNECEYIVRDYRSKGPISETIESPGGLVMFFMYIYYVK